MSNVIARVRLALGRVGFYDPQSNVHLTVSRPEADIIAGTNIAGIKRAVHNKTLRLVFGSLEAGVPQKQIVDKTTHAKEDKKEVKAESVAKPVETKVEEPVAAPAEEVVIEPVVEEKAEEKVEEVVEEKPAAKKTNSRRKKAATEETAPEAEDAEVTE